MIILDAGNTSISAARWPEGSVSSDARPDRMELESLGSLPTPHDSNAVDSCLTAVQSMRHESEPVVLVSVVPDVTDLLGARIPDLKTVDHTTLWPFGIKVDDPKAVGADRYVNIQAAAAMGWSSALIVDVGTATTFDILEDGVFVGGLIAPGPAFAARCLGEQAARLDPVRFGSVPLAPGRDTASAMAAGAFHVGVRGILGTMAALQAECPERPVVLTGGLAEALHSHEISAAETIGFHADRHWTLKGAALASC